MVSLIRRIFGCGDTGSCRCSCGCRGSSSNARLVVKETGLSFRRWRHQLQLIVALQFLIGGKSVQQAAQALGYDSTTAFITMFKKGLGQTLSRSLSPPAAPDCVRSWQSGLPTAPASARRQVRLPWSHSSGEFSPGAGAGAGACGQVTGRVASSRYGKAGRRPV